LTQKRVIHASNEFADQLRVQFKLSEVRADDVIQKIAPPSEMLKILLSEKEVTTRKYQDDARIIEEKKRKT
jgi:hypothetical protein